MATKAARVPRAPRAKNYPIFEVFGYPFYDKSAAATASRAGKLCPFQGANVKCTKVSVTDPLGVCSVADGASYLGASPLHALGAGALEYGGTSPRLYGEVFNALGKPINKTLGKWGSNTAIQALQSDRGDNGQ